MGKLSGVYLRYTFSIMLLGWGTCVCFSLNGVSLNDNYFLYVPYLLGGWSPTIASFFALKKTGGIANISEWLKNIFDFRQTVVSYFLVAILAIIFILPQCLISGYENRMPLFAIFVMIPMMIVGGGLEEAGWRYILQPELEKKFQFTISTFIVSIIWWLWHLPLFFIQGVSQYGQNYFAFGINVLGQSFALAGIRKVTGSVWLCVLFHCIVNSLMGIYVINENFLGNIVAASLLILCTCVLIKISGKIKLKIDL